MKKINSDQEIQSLKKKCYELTGKWIPYHWDCFKSIEEYKEYMKRIINEHEGTGK